MNPENPIQSHPQKKPIQSHPIYEFHDGVLKQTNYHGLPHAIVYLCSENGTRALQVVIQPGKSRTVGDHRFCFKSLKLGVTYSSYEKHDRARFKAIDLSMT